MRAFKIDSEKYACSLVFRTDRPPQNFLSVSIFSRLLRSLCLFLPYFLPLAFQKAVVEGYPTSFYFCHNFSIFVIETDFSVLALS